MSWSSDEEATLQIKSMDSLNSPSSIDEDKEDIMLQGNRLKPIREPPVKERESFGQIIKYINIHIIWCQPELCIFLRSGDSQGYFYCQ